MACLTGCTATIREPLLMDWMPIANAAEFCGGVSACVLRMTWRGEALCRMVTPPGRIATATLGRLLRECADGAR